MPAHEASSDSREERSSRTGVAPASGANPAGSRTPASRARSGRLVSASASARPMPRLAPVTRTVAPSSRTSPLRLIHRRWISRRSTMPSSRALLFGVLGLRIAYGAALVVAPARLTRRWLGPPAEQGATQVLARALGARELLLHAGALARALRGEPVRPWLAASIAGDLTDIASTAVAAGGVPTRSPRLTAGVAGGSALVSGALAFAVDG